MTMTKKVVGTARKEEQSTARSTPQSQAGTEVAGGSIARPSGRTRTMAAAAKSGAKASVKLSDLPTKSELKKAVASLRTIAALLGKTGTTLTRLAETLGKTPPVKAGKTPPVIPPVKAGKTPPVKAGKTPPVIPPVKTGKTPPVKASKTPPVKAGKTPPVKAGKTPPVKTGKTPPVKTGGG